MSSFDNIQSEPKNVFLGFLISNDFLLGQFISTGQFGKALFQMDLVVSKIYSIVGESEIKSLRQKIDHWFTDSNYTMQDIQKAYRELCQILNSHFYSELHLGIIPTSTLPTQTARPNNDAISPNQSSRL